MTAPLEILSYEATPLGVLCLRRRELLSRPGTIVTEVTLNHEFLMSSYLTESERAISRLGLEILAAVPCRTSDASGQKWRVLVGGLGLGYTAAAALASERVGAVEVIEFLPQVIDWFSSDLVPLASQFQEEPRLTISHGDIYARLLEPAATQWDLVVIDVDHSPEDVLGEQSRDFYTVPGLEQASRHLERGGVFGIWSYAEDSPLLHNMREVFEDVQVHPITVWNDLINVEQTDWLYFGRRAEC